MPSIPQAAHPGYNPRMSEVDLHAALRTHFDFPAFRPGQAEALAHVLNGQHTLVVMPTGSGKSLIYQLAALQLPGVTLVISPLIALMKDQVDSLTRRGIAATFINSTLTASEQTDRLRALSEGHFKIVLVAPERLRSRVFRDALGGIPISLLTVDEAHCLSQWGHDFRPDYLHIAEARDQLHAPIVLALTATATPRVQDDIIHMLGLGQAERIITGFNRPNLTLEVFSTPDVKAKLNFLRDFLAQADGGAPNGGGIIYTGTRRDAEEVAEFVREVARVEVARDTVAHYHGSLEAETRTRVQDAFMAGDLPIVVATNAFGMGIDRPDVRFVLHYAVPGTLEAYYQEAGRAGRDGLPARAILLYSPKDTALHEFFIENDAPSIDELRAVYGYLQRTPVTRLDGIERAIGLPQIKARVAVEQLEIAQALRREPDESFGVMRVATLPLNEAQLQAVAAQVQKRREHKYRQLEVMVDYAETNACRRRSILRHFGDTGSADAPLCCDNCLSQTETVEAPPNQSELSQSERAALIVLDTLKYLKWPIGKGKLAQLLKGSAAKDMQRFEYDQARNYGKFAALKQYEIEALIDQLIESGYVKQIGSERPTLKLTPRGANALQNRSAIRVELRHISPTATQQARAQKEAGGTIALTGQLLARGLSPDQISAERGLTVGTIYSHLAQLIAQGKVDVDTVVAAEVQQQIRATIEQVGSVQYLAPIKQRLPEEIDYNVIRCVVNAWLIEQGANPSTPQRKSGQELAAYVYEWGESGNQERIPDLIITLDSDNGNVRRLAASALGKLKATEAVEPLLALLEKESGPQVRQYTIKALGSIGDERARDKLEQIAHDAGEMDYNRLAAKTALKQLRPSTTQRLSDDATIRLPDDETIRLPNNSTDDPVADFLSRSHPRPLSGPWLAGWALDFHSRYDGDIASRSLIGELVFRYKYGNERRLAQELAQRWAELLAVHPELPACEAVIPVPPSQQRASDPMTMLAQALAAQLKIPVWTNVLIKTRATRPQKEMTSLAQKRANVAGAFALKGDVRGQRLILIDDLYDSGATLEEVAKVLTRGGAGSIVVLTLTKTIHRDA
jgi:ATP-dependent DNA helicase RecQ